MSHTEGAVAGRDGLSCRKGGSSSIVTSPITGNCMKFRRLPIVSVALLSACAALELPASAQTTASLDAVATAGKQRMLSMRTLKAYAEIAVGVAPDQARQLLAASLSELRSANAQ